MFVVTANIRIVLVLAGAAKKLVVVKKIQVVRSKEADATYEKGTIFNTFFNFCCGDFGTGFAEQGNCDGKKNCFGSQMYQVRRQFS